MLDYVMQRMPHFQGTKPVSIWGHFLYLREGNWMLDYVVQRMRHFQGTKPVSIWGALSLPNMTVLWVCACAA